MSVSDTQQTGRSGSAVSGAAITRLSGSRLFLARAVWLALVVPSLGFFVVGLPTYDQQLQRPCDGPVSCNVVGALTARGLHALLSLGFSASEYAAFTIIFWTVILAIWSAIGFLIFWRRSDEWFALVIALFLVLFNTTVGPAYTLALVYPTLSVPTALLSVLAQVLLGLFFLLFPNGRFVPRWMGITVLLVVIQAVAYVFAYGPNAIPWPLWLNGLVSLIFYGAVIFSQVYRYRRASTPVERQQTKWVVFAILIVVIGFVVFGVLDALFPALNQPDTPDYLIANLAYPFVLLSLPLSVGVAILRFRLYDIDVLINRTLVYGTLTVLLALVYVGLILGLQALLGTVIRQNNDAAIVVSTLVIAALFRPMRRRIQSIIDRRFYRRKYDAARILGAFSATLRNEVDLRQLREQVVDIVQETMQPAHVSLWLSRDEQRREPHTDA